MAKHKRGKDMKNTNFNVPIPGGTISTVLASKISAERHKRIEHLTFEIPLADGGALTGEIDSPEGKALGNILLVHGLASSCHDPSVVRQGSYLAQQGFKVFRLNHRNAGSGKGRASSSYHADRGPDVIEALNHLSKSHVGNWLMVGQSLSGNMCLKIAGEERFTHALSLSRCVGVVSISPIIDLATSSRKMSHRAFGQFDQMFTTKMKSYLKKNVTLTPDLVSAVDSARTLSELDEKFVAAALGLKNAKEYYDGASSAHYLEEIRIPTIVFAAKNYPIAPKTHELLSRITNPSISFKSTHFGGHLAFLSFSLPKMRFEFSIDARLADACKGLLK
jgi:uncharacterized protein